MAVGIVIAVSVAIAAAATAYAIVTARKGNQEGLDPQGIQDFNPTMAKEGMAVALVYGRVRLPANIIWWGNLTTVPIEEEVGGKGGGGTQTVGYTYFVDVWQAVCMGKINFVSTYVNDRLETIVASGIITNDGTESTFPTQPGSLANQIKGVAHWFVNGWNLGENVSQIPTLHFVVDRVLTTPVDFQNMANGSNPAAIIYDLLIWGEVASLDIDLTSFNAAAAYWNGKGWGLNFAIGGQTTVSQAIERVLNWVDAILYVNNEGKYSLRALDPADSFVKEISKEKFNEFSLNRKTWSQIPNDFHGTFIEETNDFTGRVVVAQNPAGIMLANQKIKQSIDLKCFRDVATASDRVWQIMKRASYPAAQIKFRTDLAFSTLLPGDVIRINHDEYGILGADFRINTIDASSTKDNDISIQATQMVETLFDDNFLTSGGSNWSDVDTDPEVLTHCAVIEAPYNKYTEFEPAFFVLAAREKLIETSFLVLVSNQPTQDFGIRGEFTVYSQQGELDIQYPLTGDIDDDIGITYTPYKFDPELVDISRASLFNTPRLAFIDNEIVVFQNIVSLGGGQYRLEGVIRKVLGTPLEVHNIGAEIWITTFNGTNLLTNVGFEDFYVKVLPKFNEKVLDASLVTAVSVSTSYKARQPRNPSRIEATRAGSAITIQLWPSTPGTLGAGDSTVAVTDQPPPFPFEGDFQVEYNSTTEIHDTDNFTITHVGAVDITVKSRLNSFISSGKTVSVGAANGVYYA